jgi:hypothetical protein
VDAARPHWHWVIYHHGDSHTVCDQTLARFLYRAAPHPKAIGALPPGLVSCPREQWDAILGPDFTLRE